ncbi:MAG TPA: MlaD family protein [Baekduia sp.]|nr:MlaD family protein [Baekduia sp.]
MRRDRRTLVALALAAAAVALLVALGPLRLGGGPDSGRTLRVEVADATGLVQDSDVKVDGIPVGSVDAPVVTARDTAMVTLHLDEGVVAGRGARAGVLAANLLGEKYVDLSLGDRRRPLPDGTVLRGARTPVQLDDVLNMLDTPTRARLRLLLNEAGIALLGRGADLNRLLDELPGSLDRTTALVEQVAGENRALGALVEHAERFAGTAARRRTELGRLVDGAQRSLAVTAREQRALGRTIAAAPGGLEQLNRSLGHLERLAEPLRPAARALSQTAAPLTQTLAALPGFERAAQPTLAAIREAVPGLSRLGRRGAGPVRRLRPALRDLATLAAVARPVTEALDEGSAFRHLLDYFDGFAGAIRNADGLGQYLRIHVTVDRTTITGLVDQLAALLPRRRAGRTDRGARTPQAAPPAAAPQQPERPRARPDRGPLDLPRLLPEATPLREVVPDVVDRTTKQLDRLLGHLLGP